MDVIFDMMDDAKERCMKDHSIPVDRMHTASNNGIEGEYM